MSFAVDDDPRDGDEVEIEGEITIKGITKPATLTGTVTGPAVDHFGTNRVGLSSRRPSTAPKFDINWNMPLPNGEPALANDVTLKADLTLVGAGGVDERPRDQRLAPRTTRTTRPSSALCARRRRRASTIEIWDGLKEIPPYDADDDVVPGPASGRGVPRARARGGRGVLRDARVQLVGSRAR